MNASSTKNFRFVLSYISPRINMYLNKLNEATINKIQEIRLRTNRPVIIVTSEGSSFLTTSGKISYINSSNCVISTQNEIDDTFNKMCGYSVHSHYEDILNGYITLPNGARVGICGTAIYDNENVKGIRDVTCLNIRIPRNIFGASEVIFDKVLNNNIENMLIVGPPSSGKTTILRDIAYQLSSGKTGKFIKVSVIDERKELFPDKNWISEFCPNIDVLSGFPKSKGIMMSIRSLSPEVIICDEIGGSDEINRIIEGMNTGVIFILSVHSKSIKELKRKKEIRNLIEYGGFEKIVFLDSDKNPGKISYICDAKEVLNENISHNNDSDNLFFYNCI